MAMPLSSATAVDTATQGRSQLMLIPAANDYLPDGSKPLAQTRYRLLTRLQSSLELEKILTLFHEETSELVDHCGLVYVNEAQQIQKSVGSVELHSCSYRLITQRDNLGEIVLYHNAPFADADLDCIETLLSTLLCPLRNALQYQAAIDASMTDPLTGAGNRLAMMTNLEHELNLTRRYHHELSLLVIDIDKFKKINDTEGHTAGDNVLREMVRLINNVNRNTDRCYRYGGEEFVVVLSKTDKYGAMVIAERLREAVASLRICAESGPLQVTVSIGAASFAETDNIQLLMNRADKAMYKVKNAGGNGSAFL
ncbi:GGDEF domain-containing protein [Pseudohongiella sp.]|uniref:GGDEF domain-containing protein n=1 Tax=marine sediment metagenome TaxID=412755 RepID=A0A0F9W2T7_9ZZZZ|nr:GGDEF domain-containing protein [Pseudohongiella sp.]HDZ09903.1 GGDEF domain-containing protein [Pseudohongiella sp.]HEA63649.1 GGDEF domain-containing protein [Pseudohongiella sp.]